MATLRIEFDSGISADLTVTDAKAQMVIEQYLRTVGGDEAYEGVTDNQRLGALLKFTAHHWQLVAQQGQREVQEASVKTQWQKELDELELVSPQDLEGIS